MLLSYLFLTRAMIPRQVMRAKIYFARGCVWSYTLSKCFIESWV